ncbi:Integral membrane protein sed5 [Verticillium dahliae VDG1]|nr:Integral membrane protein sed5 [Verticillium dahliae VDG1]
MASPAAPLRLLTRIYQGPRCLAPRSNWVFKAQGPMVPRLAASPSTPIRTFRTTPWRLDDNSKKTGPDSDSAGPGEFFSLVDNPATLVRSGGNRSRVGLFFLAIIPITVEGLLREPWKKNMFTPENRPDKWEFYFPDIKQMAALTGSQPVWIEATMEPEYLRFIELQTQGIPIGRAAEVNLRNNHAQYIFTWYGLCVATSIMLYMVAKKPSSDISRRVRMSKNW